MGTIKRKAYVGRYMDTDTPEWAERLRDQGVTPERGSGDWDAFIGWLYFHAHVPGLPDAMTPEGREVWSPILAARYG